MTKIKLTVVKVKYKDFKCLDFYANQDILCLDYCANQDFGA